MVAAAKLRKAQNRIMDLRPYANRMTSVLETVVSNAEIDSIYFNDVVNEPQRILYIVVGSDRGLCGGFNSNLFKLLENEIRTKYPVQQQNGGVSLICLGRKANEYFRKRGYSIASGKSGIMDKLMFDQAASIMSQVRKSFEDGDYDVVYLVFNEFKSVIAQNRIITQLMPLQKPEEVQNQVYYLFEPSAEKMISRLLPLYLNNQLWKALVESYASEQGARMAAMDNATENAKEIVRQLKLTYNQARQAAITTEISEIVSGAEALNG